MQPVDVLGHHCQQFSGLFQLRQLFVRRIGLCRETDHLVPVKPVKILGMPFKISMAEDGLRRHVILLVIQPILAAEVRDAAFCGNACAAKKDDPVRRIHPFLQLFDFFFIHGDSPFYPAMTLT